MIRYYYAHPESFNMLIWLYWWQSVIIGVFNFFDLITLRSIEGSDMTVNGKPLKDDANGAAKGCLSSFFLVHYGIFHLGYFAFLSSRKTTGPFDWHFFKICITCFLITQLVHFIQHKIRFRTEQPNVGKMFILPYLRIIPMHLMILLPVFLGWRDITVFLWLKLATDVLMQLITTDYGKTAPKPMIQI